MAVSAALFLVSLPLYFGYSSASGYIITAGGRNLTTWFSQVVALNVYDHQLTELGSFNPSNTGTSLVSDGSQNVYVLGGAFTDFSHKYHFGKREWLQITPLENDPQFGSNAVMVDGSIFLIGGITDPTSMWELTCDFSWHERASDPHGHVFNGAAYHNGYIYVCGPGSDFHTPTRLCNKYDISNDIWTRSTDMLSARARFSLVAVNGYIYAIGGAAGFNERFDPKTEKWSPIAPMLETRYSPGVGTDGTNIYAVAGMSAVKAGDGIYFSSILVYIVELNLWSVIASLDLPRSENNAVFVQSLSPEVTGKGDVRRKPTLNATT